MAEARHSFERCIVCGRPKRVFHSRLFRRPHEQGKTGGYFCTRPCFQKAWALFREVLRSGQLCGMLAALERARAKIEVTQRFQTSRGPDYWHDGGGLESAHERQMRELGAPLDE
jgi:hypothetical protein